MKGDKMEFITTRIKGKDLKPGDLFSTMGELYWNREQITMHESLGEKVYIRTETSCPKNQEDEEIYRIEIKK